MDLRESRRKILFIVFSFLLVSISCSACSQTKSIISFEDESGPSEIKNIITDYFEATQTKDTEVIMNVLYFPQESTYEKIAYETNVENGIYPISAVIHHVDKVNENLYAVSLNVTMANTEQSGNEVFNFVAKVDDQWRYILACTNIPKEIVGDSDLSEYWYPDNDYVSLDDVLK